MKAEDLVKIYEGIIKDVKETSFLLRHYSTSAEKIPIAIYRDKLINKLELRIQRLKANAEHFKGEK